MNRDGRDGRDGFQGPIGPKGKDGKDGRNAKDGKDGVDGRDGGDGQDGERGLQGIQGPPGPKPKHEWNGTKLKFEKPDGDWGKEVDLKGEKGDSGGGGGIGNVNVSALLDSLSAGDSSTPQEIIVRQAGRWVRVGWSSFLTMVGATGGGGSLYADDYADDYA